MGYDISVARTMWAAMEPFAGAGLLNPEVRAIVKPLGVGGMQSFFAVRSAPMGAAAPAVVIAAFHGFAPKLVFDAVNELWELVTPKAMISIAHDSFAGFARRTFGDDYPVEKLASPTDALAGAIAELDVAGHPLAAGNQAVPLPDDPWARLWRCATVAREFRGDNHVGSLVAHDLSSAESQALSTAWKPAGYDLPMLQRSRGISEQAWASAIDSLSARGLLDGGHALTPAGSQLRAQIELETDQASMRIWDQLTPEQLSELHALLTSLSSTVLGDQREQVRSAVSAPWPPPALPAS
ncbi:MAG: hypothetical protein Q8L05_11345 [Actinomycetota bacterium]|nr:hypothetical protein [Actinomycetota bacterium]MDP2288841.1 hypothetical protein [Actinomycetota bacterium]